MEGVWRERGRERGRERERARSSVSTPKRIAQSRGGSRERFGVFVRSRPLNERETLWFDEQRSGVLNVGKLSSREELIQKSVSPKKVDFFDCRTDRTTSFSFDGFFDKFASNQEVFERTTSDAISSVLEGFNATVFVYGSTGTGKTHTMMGKCDPETGDILEDGICQQCARSMFRHMTLDRKAKFDLRASFLELYLERLRDLFADGSTDLSVKEDGDGNFYVQNVTEVTIRSPEQLTQLVERGLKSRVVRATRENTLSSRSHAILSLSVERRSIFGESACAGKLLLVDLAGSERGFSGEDTSALTKSERGKINTSLLALGNAIHALANGDSHIRYRDSILTRLLKNSLGGNSKTVMIACVSPSPLVVADTSNTLHYANRAQNIQCVVSRNTVFKGSSDVRRLLRRIEELEALVEVMETEMRQYGIDPPTRSRTPGTPSHPGGISSSHKKKLLEVFDVPKVAAIHLKVVLNGSPVEGEEISASIETDDGKAMDLAGRAEWSLEDERGSPMCIMHEFRNIWTCKLNHKTVGYRVRFSFFPTGTSGTRISEVSDTIAEGEPILRNVQVVGSALEGEILVVTYDYSGGIEGDTIFEWTCVTSNIGIISRSRGLPLKSRDIGRKFQCKIVPVREDGAMGTAEYVETGIVEAGNPTVYGLGFRFKDGKLKMFREYVGGKEGRSMIQWEDSLDGVEYHPIPGLSIPEFTPTIDIMDCYVRVSYTPVRSDGVVGKRVSSRGVRFRAESSLWKEIWKYFCRFRSVDSIWLLEDGAETHCILDLNPTDMNIITHFHQSTKFKIPYAPNITVGFDYNHPCDFHVNLSARKRIYLRAESSSDRNTAAMAIRFFNALGSRAISTQIVGQKGFEEWHSKSPSAISTIVSTAEVNIPKLREMEDESLPVSRKFLNTLHAILLSGFDVI
eukprot:TRINITY_DN108_c0_g1_i2.p1 TRINITY_DN108_c0_g1~~TRINITY_DN108_c0_g1_i2.p1  ORF type:complete len:913 (-),score=220.97 TRINITY_DN108_c0_g1_i2:2179-4917(-)